LDHFRRGAKSGRAFAGIQDAEAAAGAGAHIKKTTALPETPPDQANCAFDPRRAPFEDGPQAAFFAQHQPDGFGDGHPPQLHRARISLFGEGQCRGAGNEVGRQIIGSGLRMPAGAGAG
jgi:hypothetical protein